MSPNVLWYCTWWISYWQVSRSQKLISSALQVCKKRVDYASFMSNTDQLLQPPWKLLRLCVYLTCTCSCICRCWGMYMRVYVEDRSWCWCLFQTLSTLFVETGSLTDSAKLAFSKAQSSSFLHLPRVGTAGTCWSTQILHGWQESQLTLA